jgi:poly(3-hydroxybutyrate) depolymerase
MKFESGFRMTAALIGIAATLTLTFVSATALAQPGPGRGGFGIDPRAESRTYHFSDTDEDLPYCVFVSSKISGNTPAPLIISLHGLGAGPDIMCNSTAVDLAEEGGYILAAPMGCNEGGWYGSPVLAVGRRGGRGGNDQAAESDGKCHPGSGGFGRGGGRSQPDNLAELSEKDVMNVLQMMRDEFNVDEDRIYLTGHSMGGAGTYFLGSKHADTWAAIAPVAPAAFSMMPNRAEYLRPLKDAGVPIMVVHGDMDEAVPVETSRDQWVPSMEELGIEHEYVELPGISHGPVITASQKYIYDFFGKHSK